MLPTYFYTYGLFQNTLQFDILYGLVVFWLLTELVLAWLVPLIRNRKEGAPVYDNGSTLILVVGLNIAVLLGIGAANFEHVFLSGSFFYLGAGLVVFGMLVRLAAIFTLGRYFTPFLQVVKKQKVKKSGIYRYVRHPSYTGAWISFVGIGVALRSPAAIIVISLLTLAFYFLRAKTEEFMLVKEFGREYLEYMNETKMFIPYLL